MPGRLPARPRRPAALVAWVVVLGLVPGGAELVENAACLMVDGDVAHVVHCDDAAPCPERGCSATFHLCACCHGVVGVAAQTAAEPVPPQAAGWDASVLESPILDEARRRIERPPTV